jgi:D-alanyl-D-alanine dipeptidase
MQGTRTSQTGYRFTDGEIVAQANKPLANGYALAYFNDTFAGMSGGPVLNQQGQLIGIHGAAKLTGVLGHMRQETQGIDPSTGRKLALNLGIPIDTFLNLVSNVAPNLKFAAVPPRIQAPQPTADDLLIRSIEQEFAGNVSGDNESALTLVNQAIRLQPNYGAAYLHRGHVRTTIADIFLLVAKTPESKAKAERYIAEAVVDYTEAIRLNPKLVSAYLNRGMLRRQSGDLAGALSDYNELLRLNPNSDLAYNNRAVVRLFQKDFPGALLDLDQAIRLNPYFTDAYRPIPVQQFMVDYTFQELLRSRNLDVVSLSQRDQQRLWEEVYTMWATPSHDPLTPPPHSTGAAVDVSLVNAVAQPVWMGSEIDELSPRSHPDYFADWASQLDPEQHAQAKLAHHHRQLLHQVMECAGFQRHPGEWWHFSLGDQLWAWQLQQQGQADTSARYGRYLVE